MHKSRISLEAVGFVIVTLLLVGSAWIARGNSVTLDALQDKIRADDKPADVSNDTTLSSSINSAWKSQFQGLALPARPLEFYTFKSITPCYEVQLLNTSAILDDSDGCRAVDVFYNQSSSSFLTIRALNADEYPELGNYQSLAELVTAWKTHVAGPKTYDIEESSSIDGIPATVLIGQHTYTPPGSENSQQITGVKYFIYTGARYPETPGFIVFASNDSDLEKEVIIKLIEEWKWL